MSSSAGKPGRPVMSSAAMSRPKLPRVWSIAPLEKLLPPAEDDYADEQEDCEG